MPSLPGPLPHLITVQTVWYPMLSARISSQPLRLPGQDWGILVVFVGLGPPAEWLQPWGLKDSVPNIQPIVLLVWWQVITKKIIVDYLLWGFVLETINTAILSNNNLDPSVVIFTNWFADEKGIWKESISREDIRDGERMDAVPVFFEPILISWRPTLL